MSSQTKYLNSAINGQAGNHNNNTSIPQHFTKPQTAKPPTLSGHSRASSTNKRMYVDYIAEKAKSYRQGWGRNNNNTSTTNTYSKDKSSSHHHKQSAYDASNRFEWMGGDASKYFMNLDGHLKSYIDAPSNSPNTYGIWQNLMGKTRTEEVYQRKRPCSKENLPIGSTTRVLKPEEQEAPKFKQCFKTVSISQHINPDVLENRSRERKIEKTYQKNLQMYQQIQNKGIIPDTLGREPVVSRKKSCEILYSGQDHIQLGVDPENNKNLDQTKHSNYLKSLYEQAYDNQIFDILRHVQTQQNQNISRSGQKNGRSISTEPYEPYVSAQRFQEQIMFKQSSPGKNEGVENNSIPEVKLNKQLFSAQSLDNTQNNAGNSTTTSHPSNLPLPQPIKSSIQATTLNLTIPKSPNFNYPKNQMTPQQSNRISSANKLNDLSKNTEISQKENTYQTQQQPQQSPNYNATASFGASKSRQSPQRTPVNAISQSSPYINNSNYSSILNNNSQVTTAHHPASSSSLPKQNQLPPQILDTQPYQIAPQNLSISQTQQQYQQSIQSSLPFQLQFQISQTQNPPAPHNPSAISPSLPQQETYPLNSHRSMNQQPTQTQQTQHHQHSSSRSHSKQTIYPQQQSSISPIKSPQFIPNLPNNYLTTIRFNEQGSRQNNQAKKRRGSQSELRNVGDRLWTEQQENSIDLLQQSQKLNLASHRVHTNQSDRYIYGGDEQFWKDNKQFDVWKEELKMKEIQNNKIVVSNEKKNIRQQQQHYSSNTPGRFDTSPEQNKNKKERMQSLDNQNQYSIQQKKAVITTPTTKLFYSIDLSEAIKNKNRVMTSQIHLV